MNNDVFPNKFKAALAAKQVQIGCWSALSNPISTEVLGLAGFDWLVLDGEHAPNDISTFYSAVNGPERQRQRASSASADQRAGNY
ncbi:2-dehydro-3-deoxyglucarate aldolase [Escherichia coli ISC41]|nr:2-dehydro-3-deoxyglucarate aldolase [Escherichia coli ISC41]